MIKEHIPQELIDTESNLLDSISFFIKQQNPNLDESDIKFLIAPWNHYFLHSAWHIISNHKTKINTHEPLSAEFSTPGDTLSFVELSRTEMYASYLKHSLSESAPSLEVRTSTQFLNFSNISRSVKSVGFQTCLPSRFRFLLRILSLGKIYFIENKFNTLQIKEDSKIRRELKNHVQNNLKNLPQSWREWFSQRVIEFFPKSLLESLYDRSSTLRQIPKPKNLFSANAWPLIDDWKLYAIIARRESNAKLIGSPHAVGHAWLKYFWQREYEISNLDLYLTWGWTHPSQKVIPFGSPYLAGKKNRSYFKYISINNSNEILISSAARPQHLLEYPYDPINFGKYLDNQINTAEVIIERFDINVVIRTRPSDLGWNLKNKINLLNNPKISVEYQEEKFLERIKRTCLHICDNASTAAIETLFSGHPTLIFISDDYFLLSESVMHDFNELSKVGIFHTNLDSLINQLDKILPNIEDWWKSEHTQRSVSTFLTKQSNSGIGIDKWRHALLS